LPLSFEQQNELEARKTLIRRDLSSGFNEEEICGYRGITRQVLRETLKQIHQEDMEYLGKRKEAEIATEVRTMKQRFLNIYKSGQMMYANVKDDPNISVRDKVDLLRFLGEVSNATLKIDVEGVALVRSRLPAGFTEEKEKIEQYNRINELDESKIISINNDSLPTEETEEEEVKTSEIDRITAIKVKDKYDDPQRVF
jgi:hypothetical protein